MRSVVGVTTAPSRPSGVYDPDVGATGYEIGQLSLKSLRSLCKEEGVKLPRNCTRRLAAQRLYAFRQAADRASGLEAAAAIKAAEVTNLPVLPDGANVNAKALMDFVFFTMPPYLLLLQCTRVRERSLVDPAADCTVCSEEFPGQTCQCGKKFPWITESVFSTTTSARLFCSSRSSTALPPSGTPKTSAPRRCWP